MPTNSLPLAKPCPKAVARLHFVDGDEERIRPLDPLHTSYFEVFGLPARLLIDPEATREIFLDLSRRFHPDFFAQAGADLKEESLRRSSLINNAWKTLRDDQRRAEYLIARHGKNIESNKNAVPPDLLQEMFEIQEAGEDLKEARLSGDEDALDAAEARIAPLREHAKASRARLQEQLIDLFAVTDAKLESGLKLSDEKIQELFRKIRLQLDQMNYLRTVLRNLK